MSREEVAGKNGRLPEPGELKIHTLTQEGVPPPAEPFELHLPVVFSQQATAFSGQSLSTRFEALLVKQIDAFAPALASLEGQSTCVFGPTSFQSYLEANRLEKMRTAESISIDSFERLPNSLKMHEAMVFRLGEAPGDVGTQFAIAKVKGRLRDFFLCDHEVFKTATFSVFEPAVSTESLRVFQILPDITESTQINLGLLSGLFSHALGLRSGPIQAAVTSGKSTCRFDLRLHSTLGIVTHERGQIEIDAMFIEERNGQTTLFLIEAKTKYRSLAKHKLVYPMLAVAPYVPKEIAIVPIYIRMLSASDGLHYQILECDFPDPRLGVRAIDDLKPKSGSHFVFRFISH